jgi:elongation factor G
MLASLTKLRNIGIAAHIDAGKTTTTERILFYSGRTHRMGDVDDGTTTTDFDEEEQKRGITIYSAAVSCPWKDHTINLIDTPGHVDFTAEVERSLRVLDGMIAVFSAREGVEAQSETVWRQATKYGVPRICFINKLDRVGADFEHVVTAIRTRLRGSNPVPVQLPIGESDTFEGIIDLLDMKAMYFDAETKGSQIRTTPIPDAHVARASAAREALIEAACEGSDELMTKVLEDGVVSRAEVVAALRKLTLAGKVHPVFCGSSLKYVGVQPLLDGVCDLLPSPLDVPPIKARDAKKDSLEHTLKCDAKGPLAAYAFKVVADKPLDLYFVRVYSGTLKANSRLVNTNRGEKENISKLYRMFAKRRETIDHAVAGDIVALVGPKGVRTGDTLCESQGPQFVLERIKFPETVISVSIEPKSSRDRDKLVEALDALQRQDPTVAVKIDPETGQTLISGMGELHLEIQCHRIKTDHNVEVRVGTPRVSYRETLRSVGEAEHRFDRRLGEKDHFATVRLRVEPTGSTSGPGSVEVVNRLAEGTIDKRFIPCIETGIRDAATTGVIGGYPVINCRVIIAGAMEHESDSTELAFESAARFAFEEAMKAGGPLLLQPIMDVEVVTPDDYFGSIVGDLNSRGASIRDTEMRGHERVLKADAPLAEMFGYATKLRSLSQGRATFAMMPSHYAPVAEAKVKSMFG